MADYPSQSVYFYGVYQRNVTSDLLTALSDTPSVLVIGPRQAGKSTLVQNVAKQSHPARYLSLDDPFLAQQARDDPAGFLAGINENLVIDEVQRAPDLLLAIKREVGRLSNA